MGVASWLMRQFKASLKAQLVLGYVAAVVAFFMSVTETINEPGEPQPHIHGSFETVLQMTLAHRLPETVKFAACLAALIVWAVRMVPGSIFTRNEKNKALTMFVLLQVAVPRTHAAHPRDVHNPYGAGQFAESSDIKATTGTTTAMTPAVSGVALSGFLCSGNERYSFNQVYMSQGTTADGRSY